VWKRSTTTVGNIGTGVDDLMSFTLEANGLYKLNQGIRIVGAGRSGADGNNKEVVLLFGGTSIFSTGVITDNDKAWHIEAYVFRTGASTQVAFAWGIATATVKAVTRTALTKDDSADIIVKWTGETTDTDRVLQDLGLVEALTVG
jgi:hypothetical protein